MGSRHFTGRSFKHPGSTVCPDIMDFDLLETITAENVSLYGSCTPSRGWNTSGADPRGADPRPFGIKKILIIF